LFVLVRGLAEAEAFDLLLPLWSIILISLLLEHAVTLSDATSASLLAGRSDAPGALLPLSAIRLQDRQTEI
jgi:hypothetical protein